jgi:stage III sporulation protein SpoIIIAA
MQKVDMQKAREDIENSLNKLRSEDFKKQLEETMSKVDMEEIRREMEKAKEEMTRNKEHFKVDIQRAKEDILRAKEELKAYQEMLDEMENEGLINTREDYKIQFKNKELFINGKKQSEEATEKYKKYFRHDTTIQKEDGDMNINHYRNNHKEPA